MGGWGLPVGIPHDWDQEHADGSRELLHHAGLLVSWPRLLGQDTG